MQPAASPSMSRIRAESLYSLLRGEGKLGLMWKKCAGIFFRCWTRKEAYIKATGEGLSLPLHQFDVSVAPENRDALLSTRPDNSEAALWSLREISAGAGYVAALCVRGRQWHLKNWSAAAG